MADDPGRAYLYKPEAVTSGLGRRASESSHPSKDHSDAAGPMLAMSLLPEKGAAAVPASNHDWGAAVGNLENAKVALDTLRALMADAVFLDEEAFTNATTLQLYQSRLQLQKRRIRDLEHEVEAVRVEVSKKDELLRAEVGRTQLAAQQIAELQAELTNHAAVFDLHYTELMSRNEEIGRLKAVIEGLGG